jgi:hypothetical protein
VFPNFLEVQNPIPVFTGYRSKIPGVLLRETAKKREQLVGQIYEFNREYFVKICSKKSNSSFDLI